MNSGWDPVSLLVARSHRSSAPSDKPVHAHAHTHTRRKIISARSRWSPLPGEWLTLAAKSPRGFLTFIGCQSQRARL